jgi:HSP20 family protein
MLFEYNAFPGDIQELARVVSGAFGASEQRGAQDEATWCPATDIHEDGENLVFKFYLPDVPKENVKAWVEKNVLTVEGTRPLEFEATKENYHRLERSWGKFSRAFQLPDTIATQESQAELKNGVLRVTFKKKPEVVPRQIEVRN